MPRPLLLVDIDGVLNPYAAMECPDGYGEYQLFPNDPYLHRLCALHGQWLRELTDAFEVVWASAWGCVAHEKLGSILGVEEFPFVPMPPIPFPPAEKVPAIGTYALGRGLAWLDDAIGPEARAWAAGRGEPTLLVCIDPAVGLQRADVDHLLAWSRDLARA